jgi:flavorubredoxin
VHDVRKTHVSYILPDLWTRRGVLVAAPTYEGKLFPSMKDVLVMADHKRVSAKKTAYLGSYAWSGGAEKDFTALTEQLGWDLVSSVGFIGGPKEADLARAQELGVQLARAVKTEV